MPKFKKDWSSVIKTMKEQNKGGSYKDSRIYMPDYKDDGTAKATIRFLPAPDVDVPFVSKYTHYFRGIGGWYIDNCPINIGGQCPVCEDNNRLWEEHEQDVRNRRSLRKLNYYANIIVVEDKKTPANEGKVFLFKFGKKIFDKIMETIDEGAVPFDENAGVNFYLKIKKTKVGNDLLPNYDASVFSENESSLEEICGSKEKEKEVLSKAYPLAEFKDVKQFKSYEELKAKFNKVIGETTAPVNTPIANADMTETKTETPPKTTKEEFSDEEVFAEEDDKDFFDNMTIEEN